ncbi:MAG TPA: hypothetical protein ENG34_00150 [Candidatus Aenigmarchaeota archaeon]|nr:hypothetical protein [Candidatus Aenigmarchaeota archaeon]
MYLVRVTDKWINAANLDGIRFIHLEDDTLKLDFPWSSVEINFETEEDALKTFNDILTSPRPNIIVLEKKEGGYVRSTINKLKKVV